MSATANNSSNDDDDDDTIGIYQRAGLTAQLLTRKPAQKNKCNTKNTNTQTRNTKRQ
jgi:hypothetical protein